MDKVGRNAQYYLLEQYVRFNPDAVTWPNCLFLGNTVADILNWKKAEAQRFLYLRFGEACRQVHIVAFLKTLLQCKISTVSVKDKATDYLSWEHLFKQNVHCTIKSLFNRI